jgi:hypothetical protein
MQETVPIPLLYHFVMSRGVAAGSHISIAPAGLVGIFFTREDLSAAFGGWIRYCDKVTGADWIGVWGERKASRFRRLLRERGAIFKLGKSPPGTLVTVVAMYGRGLSRKSAKKAEHARKRRLVGR